MKLPTGASAKNSNGVESCGCGGCTPSSEERDAHVANYVHVVVPMGTQVSSCGMEQLSTEHSPAGESNSFEVY